jgi:hypothetical protein
MMILVVIACLVLATAVDIVYTPGTLPIILSVPHGGTLLPSDIPDRTSGCVVSGSCTYQHSCSPKSDSQCPVQTVKDLNTQELANEISNSLFALTGKRPFLIFNNLHRSKLDPNRPVDEAAEGDIHAIAAWTEFQNQITTASNAVQNSLCHKGLLVDVHGQSHSENWIEWGYLLTKTQLNRADSYVDTYVSQSSYKNLATTTGVALSALLRGPNSFGTLAQAAGYKSVPSSTYPGPLTGNYYDGGYDTEWHSSLYGGTVDGVQMEVNYDLRANATARQIYASWFAQTLVNWMSSRYSIDLVAGFPNNNPCGF